MRTIAIHPAAPAKPAPGAACNGCGVCCLAEPCPIGLLLTRRRRGACVAVQWDDGAGRYVCGMVASPAHLLPAGLRALSAMVSRWARRFIAAGQGCDCDLSLEDDAPAARG